MYCTASTAPGRSACATAVQDDDRGEVVCRLACTFDADTTQHQTLYVGLLLGLLGAVQSGYTRINVCGCSGVVTRQVWQHTGTNGHTTTRSYHTDAHVCFCRSRAQWPYSLTHCTRATNTSLMPCSCLGHGPQRWWATMQWRLRTSTWKLPLPLGMTTGGFHR